MEAVAKSTLSEAVNRRNPEIFKALFEEILDRAMSVAPKHKFKFKNPLYAIDRTLLSGENSRIYFVDTGFRMVIEVCRT